MPDRFMPEPTERRALVSAARRLRDEGWRLVTASTILQPDGRRVLYHFERDDRLRHLELRLARDEAVPSLGSVYPGAFMVENEMKELQGLPITDLAIDYGGRLFRDFDGIESPELLVAADDGNSAREVAGALRLDACVPVVAGRELRPQTTRVPQDGAILTTLGPRGGEESILTAPRPVPGTTVVPFGPQHPVLAEPIQLELTLRDEVVVDVVPGLGYVHRGIEVASEQRTFSEDLPLLERICGICSVAHAVAYAQAVEAIAGVEIPRRARLLRTFWFELTRIHSHLLWLGLAADAIGFEALFQSCWRIRERVLDLFDLTAGNRVILGVVALGGVRRDIPRSMQPAVTAALDDVERGLAELAPFVVGNEATALRLAGVAHIDQEEAESLGLVGPTARASGVRADVRTSGYAAHDELPVEPVVEEGVPEPPGLVRGLRRLSLGHLDDRRREPGTAETLDHARGMRPDGPLGHDGDPPPEPETRALGTDPVDEAGAHEDRVAPWAEVNRDLPQRPLHHPIGLRKRTAASRTEETTWPRPRASPPGRR